ncbi:uncharacterized protein LOC18422877 isoform X1 [Amborella trichopoda]|nr:uncharacterized protein LOC18422877 isoform X1 [Amborella trichopoda]|eukprot:XP_006827628.2 uncharacterized protein LOC18422877 isoform X1 [Amborella trichopoda]
MVLFSNPISSEMAFSTTISCGSSTMACVSRSSSPNSFQLHLLTHSRCRAQNSRVFLRRSFRAINWSIRCSLPEKSWVEPEPSSPENFSGWSSPDSGQRRRGYGGIMVAGAAGLILAAGVAFASVSLKKKTGLKEQMRPLTAEQEILLASDDQKETDEVKDITMPSSNEENPNPNFAVTSPPADPNTGTDQDPPLHEELTNSTAESSINGYDQMGVTSKIENFESEVSKSDPVMSNLDIEATDPVSPVSPQIVVDDLSPSSLDVSESDQVQYPDSSNVEDSYGTKGSKSLDQGAEQSSGVVYPVETPVSGTSALNTHPQDLDSALNESESPEFPSLGTSSSHDQLPTNPLALNSSVPLESSSGQDPTVEPEIVETRTPISERDQSEGILVPVEGSYQYENVHLETAEIPRQADLFENEQHKNGFKETNASDSSLESSVPESSFAYPGIPAPSLVSAVLQVAPGKVVVPAIVDQVQGQALAALQVLKVIESDVKASDLCSRREYARWLVAASSALSRSSISKVYPAMYIENVTDLAFDDITPEDPDFPYIQGLAEAGLISSKLTSSDLLNTPKREPGGFIFSPDSPLSRQDLVSWKMALEKKQLPEVNRKVLYQRTGYMDVDKINPDAWPALVADISAGDQSITALAFGYTRLFQPQKPVTKAQAAIALATGDATEFVTEELTRIEAESLAETAVAAHTALVAQVEEDLNATFEMELALEREKIDAVEKLAEEVRVELENIKAERDKENSQLMMERDLIESEIVAISKLRHDVEEQLQNLISDKMEILFEKDKLNGLRKATESENQALVQLQYELEVERKALSMARAWAEDEAKRAREHAKALEDARERWERRGIKVIVDEELSMDALDELTWTSSEKFGGEISVSQTVGRAESLREKLKAMANEVSGKSQEIIEKIIRKIEFIITSLKRYTNAGVQKSREFYGATVSMVGKTAQDLCQSSQNVGAKVGGFLNSGKENVGSFLRDGTKKITEECREGMEKFSQKFKT